MQHNKLFLILILTVIPLPAMASNDEDDEDEDVVGEILEAEGIERNPPEINDSGEVAPPEVANTTGQISSFDEGPVVVVPP